MWAVVLRFLAPYMLQIMIGLAIVGGLTGVYFKIKHDEKVRVLQQVEKEKQDAIKKGKDARDHIRDLCNINPTGCVPDDWFRD